MPAASDILQFFGGQLFQTPQLPNTSFSGKTVVITGANQGLGFECAKHLYAAYDANDCIVTDRFTAFNSMSPL